MSLSQRDIFFQYLAQTSDAPMGIEVERAEGMYIWDVQGRSYMDMISGISVSNVGHRHPKVIEAVKAQLDKYMHLMVYGEYIQSPQTNLAQRLSTALPAPLDNVYFTNSGSEAVEGALKLAKRYTGRYELVSFLRSYHGSTQGALSVLGDEEMKSAFRPLLPGIRQLRFNSLDDIQQITEATAGVIIEPVQAEAGIILPDPNFLLALRKRCSETGALLIFDEIQTAYGRTGSLFAFEQYKVVPDILCLAKGMGGGMPLGAFISSQKIMSTLTHQPVLGHITTFGGHPISCAAGLATLELIQGDQALMGEVKTKEQLFREMLQHPAIMEIRGKGLLLAVQFEHAEINKKIISACIRNGVLVDWFLFCDSAMRIAPPLIISEEQIRTACQLILESVQAVV